MLITLANCIGFFEWGREKDKKFPAIICVIEGQLSCKQSETENKYMLNKNLKNI